MPLGSSLFVLTKDTTPSYEYYDQKIYGKLSISSDEKDNEELFLQILIAVISGKVADGGTVRGLMTSTDQKTHVGVNIWIEKTDIATFQKQFHEFVPSSENFVFNFEKSSYYADSKEDNPGKYDFFNTSDEDLRSPYISLNNYTKKQMVVLDEASSLSDSVVASPPTTPSSPSNALVSTITAQGSGSVDLTNTQKRRYRRKRSKQQSIDIHHEERKYSFERTSFLKAASDDEDDFDGTYGNDRDIDERVEFPSRRSVENLGSLMRSESIKKHKKKRSRNPVKKRIIPLWNASYLELVLLIVVFFTTTLLLFKGSVTIKFDTCVDSK